MGGGHSTERLSNFIVQVFFITNAVISSTGGELTASCNEVLKLATGSQDQSKIRRRGFHWPCEVLWVILDTNVVGMLCEGEETESTCTLVPRPSSSILRLLYYKQRNMRLGMG